MSTEQNKEIVRCFIMEVLTGRNLGTTDEVLAPNYVNHMTGSDMDAFKGMLAGMSNALSDTRFEIDDLIAEGDVVLARWTMEATHSGSLMGETPTGQRISSRGLTTSVWSTVRSWKMIRCRRPICCSYSAYRCPRNPRDRWI